MANPDERRNHAGDGDDKRQWKLDCFVDYHGGVDADGEEAGYPEIDIPGIATKNIPGRRQHDVLQHSIGGEVHIVGSRPVQTGKN
jgi:hypothetical protein